MDDHSSSARPLTEFNVLDRPRKPSELDGGMPGAEDSELADMKDSWRMTVDPRKGALKGGGCEPKRESVPGCPPPEFLCGDSPCRVFEVGSIPKGDRLGDFVGELAAEPRA